VSPAHAGYWSSTIRTGRGRLWISSRSVRRRTLPTGKPPPLRAARPTELSTSQHRGRRPDHGGV